MLVLSRKESQKIRLGDSIVITVVRLGGDKVRLGIEAPKEMLVLRDELKPFEKPASAGVATTPAAPTLAATTLAFAAGEEEEISECRALTRIA